ncbi:MAG TPA: ABC transporter ATP-binding protein [Pirellulales bacterium]|jgi:ATP-binding cassette subfamily B protein|nr:ABC transporter ATP-binding protein [Pirellulales bacterium]
MSSATTYTVDRTLTRVDRNDSYEADTRPLDIRLIVRLLSYTGPYATKRNWLLLCVLFRAIQLPALTWLTAAVIKGPVAGGSTSGIAIGAVAFLALAISTQFVMHFRQRLALELGESVVFDLRNQIFAHLQTLPMSFFNRTKLGRIISRMSSDVEDVRMGIQEVLFVSLVSLGQMAVAAGCMLWFDSTLFLMVLPLVPVLAAINHYFRRKMSIALRRLRESFSRVTATLAESVNGIRLTQGYVRQDTNGQMFGELVADHAQYNAVLNRAQGLFLPLLDLNNQFFVAALLLVGGYKALLPGAPTDVGNLLGFLFMASMFFSPISTLGNQYNQALTAMAASERVFLLLDTPADWSDAPTATDLEPIRGRIEFHDLSFGYDPKRLVLHGVNFIAEPGEMIALVGHTGSGKTSIINLIAKFYLPTAGQLLIDGRDICQTTSSSLHRQIGIVLQNNFLFSDSVLENIRVGRPEATDEEVFEAVRRLDCLDLIEGLPEGMATAVGERGGNLSLGQRQVVCFARAMLADPRILILDEATSSVDTITEARIQRALNLLLEGRTSFVVAHRLSTVRHADQVLVLDNGKIVERGRHAELLALGGTYAQLYRRFVEQ